MQPHGLTKHLQKTDFFGMHGVAGVLAFSVHTVADCHHHNHSHSHSHSHNDNHDDLNPTAKHMRLSRCMLLEATISMQ